MESGAKQSNVARLREGAGSIPPRVPPHNYEAEQALFGALLANNEVYNRVSEFLRAEHFADALHGRIYEAIGKLVLRGQIANPVTLKNLFDQDGALAEIGGAQYLVQLAQAVVTVINAEDYGRAIHDLYLRRAADRRRRGHRQRRLQHDPDVTAIDQIERSEMRLFNLAEGGQVEGGPKKFDAVLKSALDMAEAAYKRDGHVTGVTTGLSDIDSKLGGLQPSDLVILAGRPSMGKTALATNIAFNAAEAGATGRRRDRQPEDARSPSSRSKCRPSSWPPASSRRNPASRPTGSAAARCKQDDFTRFVEAAQRDDDGPFFIDDTPALSCRALRTRARRLKRHTVSDMIVVDYLQLMRPASPKASENRVQEISEITRGLKAVAKELNVPVAGAVAAVARGRAARGQAAAARRPARIRLDRAGRRRRHVRLPRGVLPLARRADAAPRGERRKFNDRMERWQERGERIHNVAEVIIAKQRHGPIGTVRAVLRRRGHPVRRSDARRRSSGTSLIRHGRCPVGRARPSISARWSPITAC